METLKLWLMSNVAVIIAVVFVSLSDVDVLTISNLGLVFSLIVKTVVIFNIAFGVLRAVLFITTEY